MTNNIGVKDLGFIINLVTFLVLLYFTISKNESRDSMIESGKTTKTLYNFVVVMGSILYWLSIYLTKYFSDMNNDFYNLFFPMIGITSYIMVIAGYEDLINMTVNRHMLRVGYIMNNIFCLIFIGLSNDSFFTKFYMYIYTILLLISFMLTLLFFVSGLGPSDSRMLMVISPMLIIMFRNDFQKMLLFDVEYPFSLLVLIGILAIVAVYMLIIQAIHKDFKKRLPLAPAIMTPMIVLFIMMWSGYIIV